jgi:hypothetical protein
MAYSTGTSFGRTAIVGMTGDGGVGVASARNSAQTVLATKVKPPSTSTAEAAAVIVAGFIIGAFVAIFISLIIGIVISGIAGSIAVAINKNTPAVNLDPKDQAALRKWQRSWICLKCGNTWELH